MGLKRLTGQEGEEGDGSSALQPKRLRLDVMREVVAAQSMQRLLTKLEPFFRRVVQEEVQKVLSHYANSTPRLPTHRIQAAVSRPYRLHFQTNLPHTLFTGSRIEAEGKMPVQIVIIDTGSNEIIRSGPLSTIKIEIVVIDGDFGGDGQDEWTQNEFSDSIVREREGKRPLLTGELVITMNNGVGHLGDANFTDNSSWIRSRKFRLGARASQSRCTEGSIHESITEAFLVKDHRGELYKKHHPPALLDEVWRLEKIGKDGAFHKRLAENQINTVQEFSRFLVRDQDGLRSILGNNMSNKTWVAIREHALQCVLDDKHYSYSNGQGVVLQFDSIFRLVGATFDYIDHPLDNLTASQKVSVNKLKELAYKDWRNIIEFNEPLVDRPQRALHMIDDVSFQEASLSVPHNPHLPLTQQDEPCTQLGFQHQPQVTCNQLLGNQHQPKDIFITQDRHPVQHFSSVLMNSFNMDIFDPQFGGVPASAIVGSIYTGEHLGGLNSEVGMTSSSVEWNHGNGSMQGLGDDSTRSFVHHLPGAEACISPFSMVWDNGNGLMQAPHIPGAGARISSCNWVKLMAALKWMTMSKRLAARRARIVDLHYPIMGSTMCANARWGLAVED